MLTTFGSIPELINSSQVDNLTATRVRFMLRSETDYSVDHSDDDKLSSNNELITHTLHPSTSNNGSQVFRSKLNNIKNIIRTRRYNLGIYDTCYEYLWGNQVPAKVEIHVEQLLIEHHDTINDDADIIYPNCETSNDDIQDHVSRMRPQSYAAMVASMCKCSIPGIEEDTKANRLVAKDWIYKEMRSNNLRFTQIKIALPTAIELVFIPDQYEIDAVLLRNSNAAQRRIREASRSYYARAPPTIFNWLGRRLYRSAPRGG